MGVNRVFTSIILTMGLAGFASAQQSSAGRNMSWDNQTSLQNMSATDTIVVSSFMDGNYQVSRFLVMEKNSNNNEFELRYKINLTKLISTYNNNSSELMGLETFMNTIADDTLKHITQFKIIGHASPDGPKALNERLAMERAIDFRDYVDNEYGMGKYPRTIESVANTWDSCQSGVDNSAISNKSDVIDLITSSMPASTIESKLKQMPATWEIMKSEILPPLRCVELRVKYNSWKVIEERILVADTEQVPVVEEKTNRRRKKRIGDDYITGLLIAMPNQPLDYNTDKVKARYKERLRKDKLKGKDRVDVYDLKSRGNRSKGYFKDKNRDHHHMNDKAKMRYRDYDIY